MELESFNFNPPYDEINLIVKDTTGAVRVYLSNQDTPQQMIYIKSRQMFKKIWIESRITELSNFVYMAQYQDADNYVVLANQNNLSYIMKNNGEENPILNFKNGYQFGMSKVKKFVFDKLLNEKFVLSKIKKPHTSNESMEILFNVHLCEINDQESKLKTNCIKNFSEFSLIDDLKTISDKVNSKKKFKFLVDNL